MSIKQTMRFARPGLKDSSRQGKTAPPTRPPTDSGLTADARPGREDEEWLNLLLTKRS